MRGRGSCDDTWTPIEYTNAIYDEDTDQTVNRLADDHSYEEVLSGETHHAAFYRLQIGDAAVNGMLYVLLDADGKIAEVTTFWRPLPSGVALQRNLADPLGMQLWELRTNGIEAHRSDAHLTGNPAYSITA